MSPSSPLELVASRRAIHRLAGPQSFERGEVYAERGRVQGLTMTDRSARATVQGTRTYRVDLTVTDDEDLDGSCSCPVGSDGWFCKHCVAVALVVATGGANGASAEEPTVDVAGYLRDLDHDRLVDLMLQLAGNDELLAARLRLDATRAHGAGAPPVGPFKDAIDAVFVTGDYVDYRDAYSYASNIDTVLDCLDTLLEDGHAEVVIELAEHALARTEDAVGYVDDSDGWLGGIAERLGELHLAACASAAPDPVALAERLFQAELTSDTLDVFSGAAATYAEVLGDEGLATYRRLAEQAWARLPALGPGDDRRSWRGDRYRVTKIMEALAATTGDVDATVAVLAHDLSSAWRYVRIVETYRNADRHPDALHWAEQGLGVFELADVRLVEALAEEYHHAGRASDAVQLIWRVLDRRPMFGEYQRLQGHAIRAGEWPVWRDKAIVRLRHDVTKRNGRDATEVASVFLDEGDIETAWGEAQAAGVTTKLWLELARAREAKHPADAIPIHQADVERVIGAKNNDAYRLAVDRLAHIATLMEAAGRPEAFVPYLAEVRARHKPKRNLMKLFDQRRW